MNVKKKKKNSSNSTIKRKSNLKGGRDVKLDVNVHTSILCNSHDVEAIELVSLGFPADSVIKNLPVTQDMWVGSRGWEVPLPLPIMLATPEDLYWVLR